MSSCTSRHHAGVAHPVDRVALQEDVRVAATYWRAHIDDWVGFRFSDGAPTNVEVAFWRNVGRHRAALKKRVPHPDQLVVVKSKYSATQLSRIADEIGKQFGVDNGFYTLGAEFDYVHVGLRADQLPRAETLKKRYGDAVNIQVGARPYPLPHQLTNVCPKLPGGAVIPGLSVATLAPNSVGAGNDGTTKFVLKNTSRTPIHELGSGAFGYVVTPGTRDVVATGPFGGVTAQAIGIDLNPGQQRDLTASFGTATCRPTRRYALAPGTYALIVVFHGAGGKVAYAAEVPLIVTN